MWTLMLTPTLSLMWGSLWRGERPTCFVVFRRARYAGVWRRERRGLCGDCRRTSGLRNRLAGRDSGNSGNTRGLRRCRGEGRRGAAACATEPFCSSRLRCASGALRIILETKEEDFAQRSTEAQRAQRKRKTDSSLAERRETMAQRSSYPQLNGYNDFRYSTRSRTWGALRPSAKKLL